MKTPPQRWRGALVAACTIQAFVIACLGLTLAAAQHARQAHVGQAMASASPTRGAPATLSLKVWVNGVNLSVNVPQAQPARQVQIPLDPVDEVDVTVTNPGPAAVPDVWFGLAAGARLSNGSVSPDGNTLDVMTRVSELPPGTSEFILAFPTANLSPGRPYNFIMGDEGNMSTIAVLFLNES